MDFAGLMSGLSYAISIEGLIFVLLGVIIGTGIGMMPGLGPITAIAVMIPITYGMDPVSAMVMMAGVYYGAVFGGSTASILLNAPGTSSAVVTAFDGYPMAQKGDAGKALAISAISSTVGAIVAIILTIFLAPAMASVAVSFGPAEYFALLLMGLMLITTLSEGSTIKALIAATLGFMAVTIGMDAQTGTARFTFGLSGLLDGIDFLVVALGLFALAEVSHLIINRNHIRDKNENIGSLKLSKDDLKEMSGPMSRNSLLGFFIGVLPGAGATMASFISYIFEKRISKNPSEFGKGSIKGIAAPETANNAAATGSFVPLLSLGIPGSGTTAVMLAALLVLGVNPGPLLIQDHPELFWGVIVSMFFGTIFLLLLNLPLIPYFSKILLIPRPLLISLVLIFCLMGVYTVSFSTFDMFLLLGFGILGYFMKLLKIPAAPFILAFILGGMLEQNLRQALNMSNGSLDIFLQSPVAMSLISISLLSFIAPFLLNKIYKKQN